MKSPRFSLSGLMAVVLVVALGFGAGKALMGVRPFVPDLSELIIFGALPMADILAIGLIPFFRSRVERGEGRPALVGFEAFGVAALLVFLGCSLLATRPIHEGVGSVMRSMGLLPGPTFLAGAVAILLVPQLALASLGAWLGRNYKIRVEVAVERRRPPGPEPIPGRLVVAEAVR